MKDNGIYILDPEEIQKKVRKLELDNIFNQKLV